MIAKAYKELIEDLAWVLSQHRMRLVRDSVLNGLTFLGIGFTLGYIGSRPSWFYAGATLAVSCSALLMRRMRLS